jgi:Protein of unknown function (DUF2505)
MRFHASHRFSAPVEAVVGLLVDPDFHRHLDLPDVELREVVDSDTSGERAHLSLRYAFVGSLDSLGRRLLGGRELTWRQELDVDPATGTGRLAFRADADPRRLHGDADFTITPADGEGSVRVLDGELVVSFPLIGGQAERRIVPGLLRRLDIEAEALEARLKEQS